MNDLNKVIELGKQFAEPWKRATRVLSVLLVFSFCVILFLSYRSGTVLFHADFNNESEISQLQE